jgi:phosphomethylpyrimidine synthase
VNLPSGGRFSNITEDVRKYAAEQAISEEAALQRGMDEKSKEFVESGAEIYQPA